MYFFYGFSYKNYLQKCEITHVQEFLLHLFNNEKWKKAQIIYS